VKKVTTRLVILGALLAAALVAPTAGATPAQTAKAADLSLFEPGNIISDAVFFDGRSLDAPTIQTFLNFKGANCVAGADGSPCLKNFRQTTVVQQGDAYCTQYNGAPNESAATIIAKVGAACGINPKVLLVLLQKEQGLVTTTNPSQGAYDNATGFACPDTSACDPAFSGFVSQVYFAGRQFQRYAAGVVGSYRAGMVNTISYYPATAQYNNLNNWRCGTSSVFIMNKATAGLYSYTPYRPNQAALAAGYGTGDSCSAYGNRNFYNYFTDWFGSTGYRITGAIGTYYINQGGGTGRLGGPTDDMYCYLRDGGCGQDFQGGAVYWSPASGAHLVGGDIQTEWAGHGAETGPMAYPGAEQFCGLRNRGCAQWFQGGAIYWSPATGAHMIGGAILKAWIAQGYETGPLGYPTADVRCGLAAGGCSQPFVGGTVYWSPASGAHLVGGEIGRAYTASGSQAGVLGYPTGDVNCAIAGGGCRQQFANGVTSWSTGTGAHPVTGPIMAAWASMQSEGGALGYPTADMVCGLTAGGCAEAFQGGFMYWSPGGGAHALRGGIGDTWQAGGAERGPLGYPTGDMVCGTGGCSQPFERGQLAWTTAAGVRSLGGAMSLVWTAQGRGAGPLGYPIADIDCTLTGGGCRQAFEHGAIVWSAGTGGYAVRGPVADAWTARGAESGPLGYPVGDLACTSSTSACSQPFQRGQLAWTTAAGAHTLGGAMSLVWTAQGRGAGYIGYPIADIDCTLAGGGCRQAFQHGTIVWSDPTGAYVVAGAIGGLWNAHGGTAGLMGYPTGPSTCDLLDGGCAQSFQRGRIYWSNTTGAHEIAGGIGMVWLAQGADRGPLGYPTADTVCVNGGCYQQFQRGLLAWTAARGVISVSGGMAGSWGDHGAGSGTLGYPTGAIACGLLNGGCVQRFDNGAIYWQQATGAHPVSGAIATSWASQGSERGTLGYPTTDQYPVTNGTAQDFQGGRLVLNSSTGQVSRG
jgi:uncharacterized protein with LGFP repeats